MTAHTLTSRTDGKRLERELLAKVESIKDLLEAYAPVAEEQGWLANEAAAALEEAGLLRMKVPVEAGGLGASPVSQMKVLARLAQIDTAAAWNTMVINNGTAFMAAFLPEEGYAEVFENGVPRGAGIAPPYGEGLWEDGGYRVTGRFRLCSGAQHAQWIRLTTFIDNGEGGRRTLFLIVPQQDVTIHDNWNVMGLRGSGSPDVSLDDYFVPERRTFLTETQYRGGSQQRLLGLPASAYEHAAIAIGLGRKALDEVYTVAASRPQLREVQMTKLGRLAVQLDAATIFAESRFTADYALLEDPQVDASTVGRDNQALVTHLTALAQECAEFAFKFVGSRALYQPNSVERVLRDIHAAGVHVAAQDSNLTELAARRVEAARGDG